MIMSYTGTITNCIHLLLQSLKRLDAVITLLQGFTLPRKQSLRPNFHSKKENPKSNFRDIWQPSLKY